MRPIKENLKKFVYLIQNFNYQWNYHYLFFFLIWSYHNQIIGVLFFLNIIILDLKKFDLNLNIFKNICINKLL